MRIAAVPSPPPATAPAAQPGPVGERRRILLLVLDGMRPGSIDAATTPHLARLATDGVTYTRSRTGFPSETMVGAGELWAGAYPERSGITANWMPVPGGPVGGIELKTMAGIDQVAAAWGGRALASSSLFEALAGAGRTSLVVGKEGPAELAFRAGATWAVSTGGAWGATATGAPIGELVRAAAGEAPKSGPEDDGARSEWLTTVAGALDAALAPDLLTVWLTDPDKTQHGHGLGGANQAAALRRADAAVGALLADLERRGQLATTDVVLTSDHGFSEHLRHETPDIGAVLSSAGLRATSVLGPGNTHAITFAEPPTAQDYARLRDALAASPLADRVMTVVESPRGGVPGDTRRDGQLTGADLRQGGPRGADAFVMYHRRGDAHFPSRPGSSIAGHGSLGWTDLNNTLVLSGPSFEQALAGAGALRTDAPAGIVDVAPTILHMLGAAAPSSMQGRVLRESLAVGGRDGVVDPVVASRTDAVVQSRIGERTVRTTLTTEHVGSSDYFVGLDVRG